MGKRIADDDVATGECSNWDHAYESAWDWIEINEVGRVTDGRRTSKKTIERAVELARANTKKLQQPMPHTLA